MMCWRSGVGVSRITDLEEVTPAHGSLAVPGLGKPDYAQRNEEGIVTGAQEGFEPRVGLAPLFPAACLWQPGAVDERVGLVEFASSRYPTFENTLLERA